MIDAAYLAKQEQNLVGALNEAHNRYQQLLGMLQLVQAQRKELEKGEGAPPPTSPPEE